MVGNLKLGFIYSGAPKTATGSFRSWLARWYGFVEISTTRGAVIPEGPYRACQPIVSVRDPYLRCIQMWWHGCMAMERNPKCHLAGCSFVKYLHRLIWHRDHEDDNHTHPDIYFQQHYYVGHLQKQTGKQAIVIRIEHWQEDMKRLPFLRPETLTTFYEEKQFPSFPLDATPMKFLSGVEEELVWEYCREDFERFGYPRLPRNTGTARKWGKG